MNIVQINTIDTRGGAAKVAYDLHRGLRKLGHQSHMFVKLKYSNDPDVHEMKWLNPLNRLAKHITGKDIGNVLVNKIRPLLANDIEYFKSDKILETREFKEADIIHCHNLHGNYFQLDTLEKIAREKPIVWTFHDMWPITPHCGHAYDGALVEGFFSCPSLGTYQGLLWDNQKRLINKKRDVYAHAPFHIAVPSRWLLEKVGRSVLADHPTSLIYNGIDPEVFKPRNRNKMRENLQLPLDKKIILFVSPQGTSEEKGGDYLKTVAAYFENQRNMLFLCVGQHKASLSLSHANVRYVPFIDNVHELATYYAAADILLFVSLAENFPLVALEALSTGLPVVSFDVGGVKEAVLHKEQGYIARYKDSGDLIEGVEYLLSIQPIEYERMRESARARVLEHFTDHKMTDNYLSLDKQLVNNFILATKKK